MAEEYEPRAIVQFGGTAVLLPVEDALAVFKMLCKGETISYSWEKKGYKRTSTDSSDTPTLKMFSVTDYASLALNSVPE